MPGREADHSLPSSAEVKEWVELYIHSPNTPSWRGAQLKDTEDCSELISDLSSSCYICELCNFLFLLPFNLAFNKLLSVSWNRSQGAGSETQPYLARTQIASRWHFWVVDVSPCVSCPDDMNPVVAMFLHMSHKVWNTWETLSCKINDKGFSLTLTLIHTERNPPDLMMSQHDLSAVLGATSFGQKFLHWYSFRALVTPWPGRVQSEARGSVWFSLKKNSPMSYFLTLIFVVCFTKLNTAIFCSRFRLAEWECGLGIFLTHLNTWTRKQVVSRERRNSELRNWHA
jgi:hypothetical protein